MKKSKQKIAFFILAVLSSVSALLLSICRVSYYFIDRESFKGASLLMLCIVIAGFFVSFAAFILNEKLGVKARIGMLVFSCICLAAGIAVNAAFAAIGWEMFADFAFYFRKSVPYFILIWCAIAAFLVIPMLEKKRILGGCLALVGTVCVLCIGFESVPYRFTANPTVLVSGEDTYSIVWATSHRATGALEIVKDGTTYSFFDENAGNIRSNDKVHHITVPASLLDGSDSYRVKSTRVIERTGYSLWSGKTIQSREYHFKAVEETAESVTIWSLSDWHEHAFFAENAVKEFPEADILFMVGDGLNEVDSQYEAVRYLLAPCADYSGSEIPVVFARGNHECRGDYAASLQADLGLDRYYYTYKLGPVGGVVLDMCEDKADDFVEYLGLADYEAYRDEEENWLRNVTFPDVKYTVCVCHDDAFLGTEEGRIGREGIVRSLNENGTDLLVSGHLHESILRPKGEGGRTFSTFVDGGIVKDKSFTAGLIEIDGDTIKLRTVNSKAGTQLEEQIVR